MNQGRGFENIKQNGHPEVIDCALQAVEPLAIGQVADDVKGGEAEPVGDIDGFSCYSSDAYRSD